jgi:hypothetical protein
MDRITLWGYSRRKYALTALGWSVIGAVIGAACAIVALA